MKKLIWGAVIFIGGYFLVKKSYRVVKSALDFSDLRFDGLDWDV